MNKAILIGRLTKDPELRFTQNGSPYCQFTVACDRPSKDGDSKEADFIQCQVWGSQAENLAKYMAKGRQIAVEGSIRVDSMERNGERSWYTKVACHRIEYLAGAKEGGKQEKQPKLADTDFGEEVSFSDEDLPF